MTAFCSIPRPTRREAAQLDDLAGPLLARVSGEALRFVAATLSASPYAPPALVRKLSDQPVDIAAPLLMRSPILTDIDLIALIGRHGIGHANAIAARADLDPRIMRLIESLRSMETATGEPRTLSTDPAPVGKTQSAADAARDRLRSMMRPEAQPQRRTDRSIQLRWDSEPGIYRKLRSTALAGVPALFHTALADAMGIDIELAQSIVDDADASRFIVSLRALCDTEEQAFLIFRCVRPAQAADARMTTAFLDAYNAVSPDDARRVASEWREAAMRGRKTSDMPANQISAAVRLRAS